MSYVEPPVRTQRETAAALWYDGRNETVQDLKPAEAGAQQNPAGLVSARLEKVEDDGTDNTYFTRWQLSDAVTDSAYSLEIELQRAEGESAPDVDPSAWTVDGVVTETSPVSASQPRSDAFSSGDGGQDAHRAIVRLLDGLGNVHGSVTTSVVNSFTL